MTKNLQNVIDALDNAFQNENGLTPDMYDDIAQNIPDTDALSDCLPHLKNLCELFKKNVEETDEKVQAWNESKKMWKERGEQVMNFLGYLLKDKFNVGSWSNGNVKAKLTTRNVLEVDGNAVVKLFTDNDTIKNALATLPPYIKVTFAVDKTALGAHLKTDPTLSTDYPELVHTKENRSVVLK